MDKRDFLRAEIKFGKFIDPFLIVAIIVILSLSVLSIRSLAPRTFSKLESDTKILGVEDEENLLKIEEVRGEHQYITSENFKKLSPTHYKYTALVQKPPVGRISKPIVKILQVKTDEVLNIHLAYNNAMTSKISIVDKGANISYVLKEKGLTYLQSLNSENSSKTLYLSIENDKPVFFNQYIEINFFVNP